MQTHNKDYACEERLVSNYRHRSSTLEYQQLREVIQTKWVIRSRPGGTKRTLKARFVAKGFTQK
eukprot:4877922-Amphidinium_carterae.1